ncbi:MAG: DUF5668 domain-containing protein [bacterium]|nr:DUF5668 domain-containing protein [bacterium]
MENLNNQGNIRKPDNGKQIGGFILVLVGGVFLSHEMGLELPQWLISWPMFLIAIGIYIGAKNQFRKLGWIIPIIIGAVFLADGFFEGISIMQFFWPVFIIGAGLYMIFGRDKKFRRDNGLDNIFQFAGGNNTSNASNNEDFFDSVAVFGGIRKNIISKDFKGGEVVCIFSGAEINLIQAEFKGTIVIDITNIFGGTKLIIPSHWKIRSEIVAILGGIDDKRMQQATISEDENVLVIKGTTILGGIEIKSY